MKFVKINFTEEEFDQIMQYGISDIAILTHENIMNIIRNRNESRYYGNNTKKQY